MNARQRNKPHIFKRNGCWHIGIPNGTYANMGPNPFGQRLVWPRARDIPR